MENQNILDETKPQAPGSSKKRYARPELTRYGRLESVTRSSPLTENTTNVADCILANCFPDPPPPIKG